MKSFRTLLFSSLSGVVCEKAIGALAAVASNHLFATLYGAQFFGELQFALSLAYVVSSAALIFSAQAVSPIFGRHPRLRHLVFYRAFRLRLGSTLSVTLLFLVIVALLTAESSNNALMLVAGLVMLCEPIALGSLMAYAETKPWVITRAKAYASGVRVLWLLAAAHASVGAVIAAFAWPLEAYVAAAAPFSRYRTLAFNRPPSLHGSETIKRTLIVRGLRMWPAIAASVLVLRMDRLLLGTLMSKADLGIYAAAASLVEQWNSVGTTLALALAPAMVFAARGEDQLRKAIKLSAYLAVIAAIALVGSLFVGRPVFLLIYGPAFEAGIPVMIFGTACSIATFVDAGLTTWLIGARHYRLMTIKLLVTIAAIGVAPFVMPTALMMYSPAVGTALSIVLFWAAVFGQGQLLKVRNEGLPVQ